MAEILDSGNRREFETGAVRDMSEGKGRFDLLPLEVIWDLAKHFEKGATKYGEYNWQKGIPVNSYWDSAVRHLWKHKLGWIDEDHAIAALWNVACMIWEERYSPRAYKTDVAIKSGMSFEQASFEQAIADNNKTASERFKESLERAFGNDND